MTFILAVNEIEQLIVSKIPAFRSKARMQLTDNLV
tara:strand:+ start:229 stop:333 length:105 start_codon:yes stop_codon:yes gene_type:complete